MFISCSAVARNLSSNFNLLFFCNLPIKWTLCLKTVAVILFFLWWVLDALWVSLSACTRARAHTHTRVCINWANTLGNSHSKQHHPLHVLILGRVQSVAIQVLCCWPYLLPFYYCILGIFLKFGLFHVCPKEKHGISNDIKLLALLFWMWKMRCLFCAGNLWPWFGRTEMRASVLSCVPWRWENSQ